jgi:AraC family transcriptional regulator
VPLRAASLPNKATLHHVHSLADARASRPHIFSSSSQFEHNIDEQPGLSEFGQVFGELLVSAFDANFQNSELAAQPHIRRGGGSLPIRMIRLDSAPHEVIDPPTSDLVIGLVLRSKGSASWGWDGARMNMAASRRPGTLGVTPLSVTGRFEVDGPSSLLIVALPFEGLVRRLEPDLMLRRDLGLLHDAYTDQPIARALCQKLWSLSEHPGAITDLRMDLISEQLVAYLAGRPEFGKQGQTRGGLGTLELARVRAAAELENADVSDLARAASMPVRTFRRRFQMSFGMPPHKWLIKLRIERAKAMLTDSDVKLCHIAIDLGFASQAHFTDTFRWATGVTPGRFRRELLKSATGSE